MIRDLFIDKLKGMAILLVVYGHCLQFCAIYDILNTKLFQLIYAFHMPFFMAVSGYLYYQSVNRRSFNDLIISRIKQLLIPFLIWSLFFLMAFRWYVSHNIIQWIKNYVYNLPAFFWFIWCLLISSMLTIIINKFFKDSLLAYLLVFLLVLLFPNGLAFYFTKFMLPYFFAGYLVHKFGLKTNTIISIIALFVFAAAVYFWKNEYYIYTTLMATHLTDLQGIYDDCYRYLAGFAGIISFIFLVKKLPDSKLFEVLGQNTLGIYFISSFLNPYLYLLGLHYDPFFYNFIYTPFVAVAVIAICLGMSRLIHQNKQFNQYLLGGR